MFTIIGFIFWVLGMVVTYYIAENQKRNKFIWLGIALVLSPLTAVIAMFVLKFIEEKL